MLVSKAPLAKIVFALFRAIEKMHIQCPFNLANYCFVSTFHKTIDISDALNNIVSFLLNAN